MSFDNLLVREKYVGSLLVSIVYFVYVLKSEVIGRFLNKGQAACQTCLTLLTHRRRCVRRPAGRGRPRKFSDRFHFTGAPGFLAPTSLVFDSPSRNEF